MNRGFSAGECGEQDELAAEVRIAKLAQEVDTRHVRHLNVGNDEIEFRAFYLKQTFFGARDAAYRETLLLQEDFQQLANRSLIVDD